MRCVNPKKIKKEKNKKKKVHTLGLAKYYLDLDLNLTFFKKRKKIKRKRKKIFFSHKKMKNFLSEIKSSERAPPAPASTAVVAKAVSTPSANQLKAWCCTIYPDCFPSKEACYDCVNAIGADCTWAIFGCEECPDTKRLHLQSYCIFEQRIRFTALKKKYHETIHWEAAKGTAEQNYEYCSKEDPEPLEYGVRPAFESNGKREQQRWKVARLAAQESRMDEVDDQIFVQHYRSIKSIANDFRKTKTTLEKPCGVWLYGVPGSGKSHKARAEYGDSLYLKGANKWWDNYQNEKHVLIEDVDPSHAWMANYLKCWADIYPFASEQKGSCAQLRPLTIIVTSNYPIEEIFPNAVDIEALKRRFEVTYFPYRYGHVVPATQPLEEETPEKTGAELTPANQFVFTPIPLTRSKRINNSFTRPVTPVPVDLTNESDEE